VLELELLHCKHNRGFMSLIQHAKTSGFKLLHAFCRLMHSSCTSDSCLAVNVFGVLSCDKCWKAVHDSTCWFKVILMYVSCHDCTCLLKISNVCVPTVWEMYTGQQPYKGLTQAQIIDSKAEGCRDLPLPSSCPSPYVQLCNRCLEVNPCHR